MFFLSYFETCLTIGRKAKSPIRSTRYCFWMLAGAASTSVGIFDVGAPDPAIRFGDFDPFDRLRKNSNTECLAELTHVILGGLMVIPSTPLRPCCFVHHLWPHL